MQGAHRVHGSFEDYNGLVEAVKLVDIVISAISGVHTWTHQILLQLKLVEAMRGWKYQVFVYLKFLRNSLTFQPRLFLNSTFHVWANPRSVPLLDSERRYID
ncbi:unnamed protein product [Fraxinus pennsylvanica]|uniref:NmrA-like domain-containing protein n=1 Tax=Fraxinus pennsylvanica TaxID=56036 RepID=A0AAD1ZU41_9LAMI|nr:unnamed protein product [Fraxinus pennsylvanica]